MSAPAGRPTGRPTAAAERTAVRLASLAAASADERLRETDFADVHARGAGAGTPAGRPAALDGAASPRPAARGRRRAAVGSTCAGCCAAPTAPAATRPGAATGGAPTAPRRLVLLADVSGSMEAYARVYLHLLHGAVARRRAPRRSCSPPG